MLAETVGAAAAAAMGATWMMDLQVTAACAVAESVAGLADFVGGGGETSLGRPSSLAAKAQLACRTWRSTMVHFGRSRSPLLAPRMGPCAVTVGAAVAVDGGQSRLSCPCPPSWGRRTSAELARVRRRQSWKTSCCMRTVMQPCSRCDEAAAAEAAVVHCTLLRVPDCSTAAEADCVHQELHHHLLHLHHRAQAAYRKVDVRCWSASLQRAGVVVDESDDVAAAAGSAAVEIAAAAEHDELLPCGGHSHRRRVQASHPGDAAKAEEPDCCCTC